VDSSNAASLALVCQKIYNPGVSTTPLVTDGIAYFPTWNGLFVTLNYRTCCTLWETNITDLIWEYKLLSAEQTLHLDPVSRTSPVIGKHGDDDVLYIGTLAHALVLAIDKMTGKLIDALSIDRSQSQWKAVKEDFFRQFYASSLFHSLCFSIPVPGVTAHGACITYL
jgi:hypothetical protein